MLPALNHHAELAQLASQDYNRLKDQLEFASRDIEEERRERSRMKEQLAIQNDIINRLYSRLNQIEEQQAGESKIVSRLLDDAVSNQRMISESQRQNRLDKNTVVELQTTKDKFNTFSHTIKEETHSIHQLTAKLKDDIVNAQDYINKLYLSDQNNTGRVSKLESNTNVAMECIKSLQSVSKSLESKIKRLAEDTNTQESEITGSLQQLGDCLNQAKDERNALEEKLNKSVDSFNNMLSDMKYELQQKENAQDKINMGKENVLIQSIEDISRSVKTVEERIAEDMSFTLQESKSLIGSVQGDVLKERSMRMESEKILRRETANVINNLREHLSEQLGHSIKAYQKDREKIQKSIKQLNESISIIEKSNDATKYGLEHIIQAEIKSRLSQVKAIEDSVKTTQAALGAVDDRREQDFIKLKTEIEDEMKKEFESTRKQVEVVEETLSDVKLVMSSLQEEVTMIGDNIIENKREIETLMKVTEESILAQVHEQLDSVWTQIGDIVKTSSEQVAAFKQENAAFVLKLQKETDDRTSDLLETGRLLDTKLDKLAHQAHVNTVNKSLFEQDEKWTNLESLVEAQNKDVRNEVENLQTEVYTINKLLESLKEHEIENLKKDFKSFKDGLVAGPSSESPKTPELTVTESDMTAGTATSPTVPPTYKPNTPERSPQPSSPHPAASPADLLTSKAENPEPLSDKPESSKPADKPPTPSKPNTSNPERSYNSPKPNNPKSSAQSGRQNPIPADSKKSKKPDINNDNDDF